MITLDYVGLLPNGLPTALVLRRTPLKILPCQEKARAELRDAIGKDTECKDLVKALAADHRSLGPMHAGINRIHLYNHDG